MNLLRPIFEKIVLTTFVLCFSFVALYTPQIVHAGGGGAATGGATEFTQIGNNIILGVQQGFQKTSAMANSLAAASLQAIQYKEFAFDGIAWSLAKGIVSQMTSSIISWVNSGFQGSPAFVTNLQQTLTRASDRSFDQYLSQLGGPFSSLCAPFRLNVRTALASYYENVRSSPGGVPRVSTSQCSLTGALTNLEGLIENSISFADPTSGGWDAWLQITTNPAVYTPYGSFLEGVIQTNARIESAKSEQLSEISFGQGFLSAKVCEEVDGPEGPEEQCTITTPGKVINEALTFQTSAGTRSLIEADELNELLSSVFSNIKQQAITGSFGLLGLSGGTGFTVNSGGTSFTDRLIAESLTIDPNSVRAQMVDALAIEQSYLDEANHYRPRLLNHSLDITRRSETRNNAREAVTTIDNLIPRLNNNISQINLLITEFDVSGNDPNTLQDISSRFLALRLHTSTEVESQVSLWGVILR